MKIEDIKVGDFVIIGGDLSKTDSCYHANEEMKKMRYKRYQVDNKKTSSLGEPLVSIMGFNWHPDDLWPGNCKEEKDPQLFHFDSEGLDI